LRFDRETLSSLGVVKQDIGTSLLADIDRQLRAYVESQQQTMANVMTRFFDPNRLWRGRWVSTAPCSRNYPPRTAKASQRI